MTYHCIINRSLCWSGSKSGAWFVSFSRGVNGSYNVSDSSARNNVSVYTRYCGASASLSGNKYRSNSNGRHRDD
jgi:hypothetical protein